jgi:hypothetical protein
MLYPFFLLRHIFGIPHESWKEIPYLLLHSIEVQLELGVLLALGSKSTLKSLGFVVERIVPLQ